MKEYILISVCSKEEETQIEFSQRLSQFWTQMLRQSPEEFEKVYAECTEFEIENTILVRKYAILPELADFLKTNMENQSLKVLEIDPDDIYNNYEITAPEWMQIEH